MVEEKYQGHFEEPTKKKCVLFCVFCVWQHTNSKQKMKKYNLIDCAFHLVQIFVFTKLKMCVQNSRKEVTRNKYAS